MNTNNQTDFQVHQLIHNKLATTTAAIKSSAHLDDSAADNALRRLKSAGKVQFDKATKKWSSLSQPSALPAEGVEGSADTNSADATSATEGNSMEPKIQSNAEDIDKAIADAKAKKGQKPAKDASEKRPRLTDDERTARDVQRDKERAEKKTEREAMKLEKQAQRDKDRPAAHMSKVLKASAKLPVLEGTALQLFNDATVNLGVPEVAALAAHLQHFNRTKATERALNQTVGLDDIVLVTGGDARYIGQTGKVTKSQRIRCYVAIEGVKKDVYLFTSDVQVTQAAPKATAAAS